MQMWKNFKTLDKDSTTRVSIFAVLLCIAAPATEFWAVMVRMLVKFVVEANAKFRDNGPIYIDGADASFLNDVGIAFSNTLCVGVTLVMVLGMLIVSAIVFGVFSFAKVRGRTDMQKEEYLCAKDFWLIICGLTCLTGMITIGSESVWWAFLGILLTVPMFLFGWVFYIRVLKKRTCPTRKGGSGADGDYSEMYDNRYS